MRKYLKYDRLVTKIETLVPKYMDMSDAKLQQQTDILRQRLAHGETLDQIMVDAFAVVIEADRRVLGLTPFHVQILGAVVLYFGNVAEIKTGEGKTLVATMPMYTHALTGTRGNFLITVNEFLAKRDGKNVGRVYQWLGLSVGISVGQTEVDEKKELYDNDIIFSTEAKLGFDYLLDNLGADVVSQVVTNFNYAIIDEIDAVLLDAAQTALVISGAPKAQSSLFGVADWVVKSLNIEDFERSDDRRRVWLTTAGQTKIQQYLGIKSLFSVEQIDLYRHIMLALQANQTMDEGRQYVVDQDEIVLINDVTGRKMPGVRFAGGLHQAIEAKEGVPLTKESRQLGSISYQNLFQKFTHLSGMTGTAKTDAQEFLDLFGLLVIVIPTNKPNRRHDFPEQIFATKRAELNASVTVVRDGVESGRPVLVETGSLKITSLYSLMLLNNKIPHNVLSANSSSREQEIIDEAGLTNAVTLSTAMVGRGTDIQLSSEAEENGGLVVVTTERLSNQRADNQLRGRAARQSQPGETHSFVSFEDPQSQEHLPDLLQKYIHRRFKHRSTPLTAPWWHWAINWAQHGQTTQAQLNRRETIAYNQIINFQRQRIYDTRNWVLNQQVSNLESLLTDCAQHCIDAFIENETQIDVHQVARFVFENLAPNLTFQMIREALGENPSRKQVVQWLRELARERQLQVFNALAGPHQRLYFAKVIILKAVDEAWIDQLEYLQQLRQVISGHGLAFHRPINEFGREARLRFDEMKAILMTGIFRNLMLTDLTANDDGTLNLGFP